MIATDKFIFAHLPRTGGTFISDVIKKFFPSAQDVGHHLPRELLPAELSHLPVLGTVRNPWDFYVSLYHYLWPKDAASILASWMTENGKLGFSGSVQNLLNLGVDDARREALTEMLPERLDYSKRNIPGFGKDALRRIAGTEVGYFTLRFNQIFGHSEDVFFCRVETLPQDLLRFFDRVGAMTTELHDYVLGSAKINAAEHLHYSQYYTPDIAELVLHRDQQLIKRFGYKFENAAFPETPTQL